MLSVSTVIAGVSSVLAPAAGSAAGWVSYVYVASEEAGAASEEAGAASSVLAESVGGGAVMSAIEIGVKLSSLASVFVSMSSSMAEAKVVNEAATSAAANLIIFFKITVFLILFNKAFLRKNRKLMINGSPTVTGY